MADDNSAFVLQPLTNESAFSEPALSPIATEHASGEGKQGFPGFNEAAAVGTIVKSRLTTMSNERLRNWNDMILGKYQLLYRYSEIWKRFQNNMSFYSFNYVIVIGAAIVFCSFFSASFFFTALMAVSALLYFSWWRTAPLVIADKTIPLRAIQGAIGTAAVVLLYFACGPVILFVFFGSLISVGAHATLRVSREETVEEQFESQNPV